MKGMVKTTAHLLLSAALMSSAAAWSQSTGSSSGGSGSTVGGGGQSQGGGVASPNLQTLQQAEQQASQPGVSVTPNSGSSANGASNTSPAYRGSLIEGKATSGVLQLSLDDAISRGLRNNLGLILQSSQVKAANGQRLEQLQALLPTVNAAASIEVEQVNLAAFGLKFPGLNPIIGPYQVVDFRAYLTQNLSLEALQTYLAGKHNFQSAKLSAEDARNLVVLTVGNAYLMCLADESRIRAVNAQIVNSQVSLKQATDAHEAGTSPRIDVLRAQVDLQNEQQNLIATTNQFAKDKIALARAIGLPLDQAFTLGDDVPYAVLDTPEARAAFQQALKQRKDLQAADETLKSAQAAHKAAIDDQIPGLSINGDYGDIGTTPGHSHGTFTATGQVSAPILQLARTRGDAKVAEAREDQAKAQLSDAIQGVNADVRDAILDIQTAQKLVDAARSNVTLAHEAYTEAEDRFKAGVSDEFQVSEALATSRQADDQYISALYQHNVAKLSLARALGEAGSQYKQFLSGVPVPATAPVGPNPGVSATGATQIDAGGK